MRAQDIMTTQVVAVEPDTPVREVARIMVERRISEQTREGAQTEFAEVMQLTETEEEAQTERGGGDLDAPLRAWAVNLVDGHR